MKAGYQTQIRSWENDGDNYQTMLSDGLSEADARFYVWIAEHFMRGQKNEFGIRGNDDNETDAIFAMFDRALELFPNISEELKNRVAPDDDGDDCREDGINEFLCECIAGTPNENYDSSFYRTVDQIKVYYLPQDVEDVTDKIRATL